MLVFHELVYEGYVIVGTAGVTVFTPAEFMPLLGAVDAVHVSGYASQVTGTSPVLRIYIETSNDRIHWIATDGLAPVINDVPLSTSAETFFQGVHSNPALARLSYAKLKIELFGTNPRGFLRIWVTGRDRSRRSAKLKSSKAMGGMLSAPGRGLTLPNGMKLPNGMLRPKL